MQAGHGNADHASALVLVHQTRATRADVQTQFRHRYPQRVGRGACACAGHDQQGVGTHVHGRGFAQDGVACLQHHLAIGGIEGFKRQIRARLHPGTAQGAAHIAGQVHGLGSVEVHVAGEAQHIRPHGRGHGTCGQHGQAALGLHVGQHTQAATRVQPQGTARSDIGLHIQAGDRGAGGQHPVAAHLGASLTQDRGHVQSAHVTQEGRACACRLHAQRQGAHVQGHDLGAQAGHTQ